MAGIVELVHEPTQRNPVSEHLVQVYRNTGELAESVATFLSAGFDAGEPAIVVATGANWPAFSARLQREGWVADTLEREGLLFLADADATLAAISENGQPALRLFSRVIGGLMDTAAASRPTRRLRVFGEMVDLLVQRGDPAAADALEDLWNRLGSQRNFSLLCGYRIDVFDRESQVKLLPQVCRSHTHTLPDVDPERLEFAVNAALIETLGPTDAQKVYNQAAKQTANQQVPSAQVALMWVSAHMPRAADSILRAARTHYLTTATP